MAAYVRLVAPGGLLVLEEPDSSSWHCTPDAARTDALIALVLTGFREAGGDFDAGRHTFNRLRGAGVDPQLRAEVVALQPGHPYLLLPVQFAASLREGLERLLPADQLDELVAASTEELRDPGRTGLTFTLVQTWCVVPGGGSRA